jgi:hypothetical protein
VAVILDASTATNPTSASNNPDKVGAPDTVATSVLSHCRFAIATAIVIGLFATTNDWLTDGAAANEESPACNAVTVHVPADTIVTETPDTVHTPTVDDANVAESPDDAVARGAKFASPYVLAANGLNVIVWLLNPAVTVCVTRGAAATFEFPAWSAATTHEPEVRNVTTPPDREQTVPLPVVTANDTTRPDVDVAVGV